MLQEILNKNLSLNWSYDKNKVEVVRSFSSDACFECVAHVYTDDSLLEVFQLGSFWYNGFLNGVQVVSGVTFYETQKKVAGYHEHIQAYKERGLIL